jgi:hypothetical protein
VIQIQQLWGKFIRDHSESQHCLKDKRERRERKKIPTPPCVQMSFFPSNNSILI